MSRTYIAIDLKSFYASVECRERGLDPLTTNLVVADESRTEKTICLAVSPSLKSFGIPARPRLFEVVQKIKEANSKRLYQYRKSIRNYKAGFLGSSHFEADLKNNFSLSIENLREFKDDVYWRIIDQRDDFLYTNELIESFPDYINWSEASRANTINFTIDFVKKYSDRWDWKALLSNPLIVQKEDLYYSAFKRNVLVAVSQ